MTRLIPLADENALKDAGIFYRPGTLRRMYHQKDNPRLFRKIRRRLFVDIAEWQNFLQREIEHVTEG